MESELDRIPTEVAAPDSDLMMKALVALGGEVFVLRAEMEAMRRLRIAGEDFAASVEDIRRSADFQAWLSAEGERFARNLLSPVEGIKGASR